jgi:hypothetical protein
VAVQPAGQPCDLHHHARYREPKTERAWRGVRIDRVVQTESRDAGRSVPDRLTAALSYHQQSNFDVRPGEEGPAMLLPSFARRPRGGGPACSTLHERHGRGTTYGDVGEGPGGGTTSSGRSNWAPYIFWPLAKSFPCCFFQQSFDVR